VAVENQQNILFVGVLFLWYENMPCWQFVTLVVDTELLLSLLCVGSVRRCCRPFMRFAIMTLLLQGDEVSLVVIDSNKRDSGVHPMCGGHQNR